MSPLAAVRHGEGPTVVLLHGFTQTSSSWSPLLAGLSSARSVLAVDLPGHGGSSGISADLDEAARLVEDVAGGEPFDLVGYSMGGRVALHVACRAPATLRRVVSISASVGIADPEARAARLATDRAMADELESDGDVSAFVAHWLAAPIFATLAPERADVAGRSQNTAAGLADSLRRCSVGAQRWLGDELAGLSMPLHLLAGARDDPYVAAACRVAGTSSTISAAVVPGAGHACHLEQPAVVVRLINAFLGAT